MLKIEIFAPETVLSDIQEALLRADAGHLGNYRGCLSWSRVTGSWIPEEGAHPAVGSETIGERVTEPEIKIEAVIPDDGLTDVISEIKRVHPYEEPLINVLQLIEINKEKVTLAEDEIRDFITRYPWTFAKTYAKTAPHEYYVKKKLDKEGQQDFVRFITYIRDAGFPCKFGGRTHIYYEFDGRYYWTMGDPVEETNILNRCLVEDYVIDGDSMSWKGTAGWKEKKASDEANARYNEVLNYGLDYED